MSSKNSILSAIKKLNQKEKTLPEISAFKATGNLEDNFTQSILSNKGTFTSLEVLTTSLERGDYRKVFSAESSFSSFATAEAPENPADFADLDLAILKGQFGVAENGAIWLEDIDLKLRATPFITAHLVILLEKNCLVSNMHEAYERIGESSSGFGLFLAGPSKTADIEQSLVIGAHGAKSLVVILI